MPKRDKRVSYSKFFNLNPTLAAKDFMRQGHIIGIYYKILEVLLEELQHWRESLDQTYLKMSHLAKSHLIKARNGAGQMRLLTNHKPPMVMAICETLSMHKQRSLSLMQSCHKPMNKFEKNKNDFFFFLEFNFLKSTKLGSKNPEFHVL